MLVRWKKFPPENPIEGRQILVRRKNGNAENEGYDIVVYWDGLSRPWWNGDVFYGNDSFDKYRDLT